MILRLSDSLSRGLIVGIACSGGGTVLFFGPYGAGRREQPTKKQPRGFECRPAWSRQNADYWYRFAHFEQFNLEETDPERAKDF